MERNTLLIIVGIIVAVIIVAGAAYVVLNNNSGSSSATPTPTTTPTSQSPSGTQQGSGTVSTPIPGSSTTPAPGTSGPIVMDVVAYQKLGYAAVSLLLNSGYQPVDMSQITMNIVSNGQTYTNVMPISQLDWGTTGKSDNLLGKNDTPTAQINYVALGIPSGQTMTFNLLQNGAQITSQTVTPVASS